MKSGGDALASIIEKKRKGAEHSREEIDALVDGYCAGEISDDAFARWLRAVMASGLSIDETVALTRSMASSGDIIDWRGVPGTIVDKHSTGGVGDDVSLIAVPLASACGVKVAKLSGRALGHTGGTLDKLECIPGLQTQLSIGAFKAQVAEVGCAIAGASETLAPADKKIYELRHRTHTIDSVPLIAASVLSKKIAGGAPHLVIDVKAGRCAFMQTLSEARELAYTMLHIASRLARSITILITDMESPLACSVGDALELDEALRVLQGRDEGRLCQVALAVAEAMLSEKNAATAADRAAAELARPSVRSTTAALEQALHDGSGFARFAAMVDAQGGNLLAFDRRFEPALTIAAQTSGYVASIDGRAIGEAIRVAHSAPSSAGRDIVRGNILGGDIVGGDCKVAPSGVRPGVRLKKREGEAVSKGEVLMEVFGGAGATELADRVRATVCVGAEPPAARPAVIERLHAQPL